jgi:hypothetical protein
LTAANPGAILFGMKGWIFALGFSLVLAGPARAQTPTDWRAVASAEDISLVENWERYFDRAMTETARTRPGAFYGITREELAEMKNGAKVDSFPARWEGVRPCRTILTQFFVTVRYSWFECRLTRDGGTWRIEKLTGSWRMLGQVYPDPFLGSVVLERSRAVPYPVGRFGDGAGGDGAGLIRLAERRWLRILLPGPYNFDFLEIDLHVRLRRRAP